MAFMTPEVVGKQEWFGVETSAGLWWVPINVLSQSEIESARRGDFEPLLQYTEGNKVYNDQSMIKKGYGVRLSARGYMDSTDWEVYGSKKEALKRARELAREAEGEDYATKKKARVRHATKKSPAQLQREIDETLAGKGAASRYRVGGKKAWTFDTLEAAKKLAERIWQKSGALVAVEEIRPRSRTRTLR